MPADATAIEDLIAGRIAARRRCPPESVDPQLPFHDQGIDSLDAMSIAEDLGRLLGRPLDPALLYDHPTPRALAAHLAAERR